MGNGIIKERALLSYKKQKRTRNVYTIEDSGRRKKTGQSLKKEVYCGALHLKVLLSLSLSNTALTARHMAVGA